MNHHTSAPDGLAMRARKRLGLDASVDEGLVTASEAHDLIMTILADIATCCRPGHLCRACRAEAARLLYGEPCRGCGDLVEGARLCPACQEWSHESVAEQRARWALEVANGAPF